MSEPHPSESRTNQASAPDQPKRGKLKKFSQSVLKFTSIAYLVFLFALYVVFNTVGEGNTWCSLLLYSPPQIWLIPCLVLALLSVAFHRRSLLWSLCSVFFVLTFVMQWHWSWQFGSSKPALKILSANIGQRHAKLDELLKQENPDVCLFQEGWRFGLTLSRHMPGYYTAAIGEFSLASKYEIVGSGFVPKLFDWRGVPVAAWFEIKYQGRRIIIYNVHLPTPRRDFERLRGKGWRTAWREGGGIFDSRVRADYQEAMQRRLQLATKLKQAFDQQKKPFIAAGDFNMPAQGVVRDVFTEDLTDVFAEKGRGYGFTFPGNSGPFNLAGAWLRLDYIFLGGGWDPVLCRVEPKKDAQHLAVIAHVRLQEERTGK